MDIGNSHRKDSLPMPGKKKKKLSEESSLESDMLQLAIYPEKTIIPKDTCSPTFTATLLTAAKTQT